ncbi:hypothetical protein COO60DRAFT_1475520, partial [Scenedesmus sp. NREL 46B-D3]
MPPRNVALLLLPPRCCAHVCLCCAFGCPSAPACVHASAPESQLLGYHHRQQLRPRFCCSACKQPAGHIWTVAVWPTATLHAWLFDVFSTPNPACRTPSLCPTPCRCLSQCPLR